MNLIQKIVDDLKNATYRMGSDNYSYNVLSEKAIPVAQGIIAQDLEDEIRKTAELEAKCFAYEAIISNSNFAPVFEVKKEPRQDKITEEMIMAIWGTLIEAGNHDTERFRLGETIRYNPDEVADILRMKFIGGQDNGII